MTTKNRIKTILTLAFVAIALTVVTANAGSVGELGVLDLTANGEINPNTGVKWATGDQYRLAFHTLGKHDATSNDPADYNAFVTAEAQLNPALAGSTWFALVSVNLDSTKTQADSPKIDAKTNSGTDDLTGGTGIGGAGVPVYAMDGTTCIARNNADIWNGWSNPFDGDTTVRIATGPVHYSPFLDQYGNQTVNPDTNHGMNCITGSTSNGNPRTPLGNTTDSTTGNWGSSNANNPGRVWLRWDSGSLTDNWSFYAISELLTVGGGDPNLPDVDAGEDMISWSGAVVALDPNVVNNDTTEPQGDLEYLWTAEPDGIGDPDLDVAITGAATENASVTITKAEPTGDATVVTMTLSVTLPGKDPETDSMTIDVYDDACLAAKAAGPVELDATDIDGNCITAFPDFAVMAATWLDDYTLTEAVAK